MLVLRAHEGAIGTWRLVRSLWSVAVLLPTLLGCRAPEPTSSVREELSSDRELTAAQTRYLAELADIADRAPHDRAALKASGMAHLRFTLSGVLSLQARAEADLERAFRIDAHDPELNRVLGRFYNLRAVEADDSKADMQVTVYGALLGSKPLEELDSRAFVAWSFFQLGQVLVEKKRGNLVAALGTVKRLEAELERRTRAAPDDMELFALAGNFAFFFAGNIPFGRHERVVQAVRYFETLRANWTTLRFGARDPEHCPNTYQNFMFELAEGYTVLGESAKARVLYEELSAVEEPRTRAKEEIAYVAAERLRHHDAYLGKMELMPPWPSDIGNCVVCHTYSRDVPLTSLYSVEDVSLRDVPSNAIPKPVNPVVEIPAEIRRIVDIHCIYCHSRGGEAEADADFAFDEGILARIPKIRRRVAAGEMPPDRPLSSSERQALVGWSAAVLKD